MSLYGNPYKAQNSAIASSRQSENTANAAITILAIDKLNIDGANATLPTADTAVAGALWSNSGIVTVSA